MLLGSEPDSLGPAVTDTPTPLPDPDPTDTPEPLITPVNTPDAPLHIDLSQSQSRSGRTALPLLIGMCFSLVVGAAVLIKKA